MDFSKFADVVRKRFDFLSNHQLYVVGADKNDVWDLYLNSFPVDQNSILKTKREYDCNTCKIFIRDVGGVCAIIDDKIQTVWDVQIEDPTFQTVALKLAEFVRSRKITDIFFHWQATSGAAKTNQLLEDKSVRVWNHFSCKIPQAYINKEPGAILNEKRTAAQLFERGVLEISEDSIDVVLELMNQGSLYRGTEFSAQVKEFKKLKLGYIKLKTENEKNIYIWQNVNNQASRIRNTVIGTLLQDLSEGVDLDAAVGKFESKVAPTNYKRPTALITKGMVEQAMKTVSELGIENSLHRRFAAPEDITVNNILFTDSKDSNVVVTDSLSDTLMKITQTQQKDLSKVEEIEIEKFIKDVLPNVNKIKVYVEGRHVNNLVSLVAPEHSDAPRILKWNNNFSWSYNGDITDSIKERVKNAGGKIDAFLRVSLSWFNFDDLDLHVTEPPSASNFHIDFGQKNSPFTGGHLDIDMNAGVGRTREAVENTVWSNKSKIKVGWYKVQVHNFCRRETKDIGFDIQTEFNNEISMFGYRLAVPHGVYVPVLDFYFDGNSVTEIKTYPNIEKSGASKEVWGISTNNFIETSMLTLSPNYWDDQTIGNKHYFFILKDCKNEDETRGIYNEFLNGNLDKHRKVFEVIGNKLKCKVTDRQLSGIGFSSTKRDTLVCKVEGKFNRTLKIKF